MLTFRIPLPDWLYFLRYWPICELQLLVYQFVTLQILKLTLAFLSSYFPTASPKSQGENLNILRTKRAFSMK